MDTRTARDLTRAFYDWEAWGRGWLQAPEPVELEPPLEYPRWHRPSAAPLDDTRRPHWLKRLLGEGRLRGERASLDTGAIPEEPPRPVAPAAHRPGLVDLELLPRSESRFSPGLSHSWLTSLSALRAPLSFEIVANAEGSTLGLAYAPPDHALVASSLRSVAPSVEVRPVRPLLERWSEPTAQEAARYVAGFEFALAREFVLPLGEAGRDRDQLSALLSALDQVEGAERAVWQVLVSPAREAWGPAILAAVVSPTGHPFFADAPEITKAAERKVETRLYAAVVRLLVSTDSAERAFALAHAVTGALAGLSAPLGNALAPLSDTDAETLSSDVLSRSTRRLGMVLSARELAGLVTLPADAGACPGLRLYQRAPTAPRREEGVLVGTSGGEPVRLGLQDRLRHVHVVGASGTGKSNLLVQMVTSDMRSGAGLAVLDPHGDLADRVLERVPDERLGDVVVLDPADPERVVGWNVLEAGSGGERELLASDLVGVFRRLSTSWGDQMTAVLANAVLAFLDSPQGGTLLELRRFLVDEPYRRRYLATIRDPHLASFWEREFALLVGRRPQTPILTRLDALLRHRLVRDVLTLRTGALDFRRLLDGGKILVARLSQGRIGRENAALVGSLLVSRLQQAALSRQDTGVSGRTPFFLYLDEFHELAAPSMAALFSGIRKYGVGLTVAHQDLYQLKSTEPELERSVMGNAHVRIAFRVGEEDARRLASGFGHFTADDLAALPVGQALARIGGAQSDFRLATGLPSALDPEAARERRALVERRSRERYAVDRPTVTERAPEHSATAHPPSSERVRQRAPDWPQPMPPAPPAPGAPAEPAPAEGDRSPQAPDGAVPSSPLPRSPSPEGRGGPEHRYLQALVRSWAQERGYRADLEVELEGGGRVDLVLARPGEESTGGRIAVEISVTTGVEHEAENARKCLVAGFDLVALVSAKRRFRASLAERLAVVLSPAEQARALVLSPEELLAYLSARPADERTVAGYAVRTRAAAEGDVDERRERLNRVISESLRRLHKR